MGADYYKELGLSKDASDAEVSGSACLSNTDLTQDRSRRRTKRWRSSITLIETQEVSRLARNSKRFVKNGKVGTIIDVACADQ